MTIDERLEKLTERHEALAQTVEIMAADIKELAAQNKQMAAENKRRDRRIGEIMEGIARLLHIAEIQDQRIEPLEGGQR
jgi:archaellum component FlaC